MLKRKITEPEFNALKDNAKEFYVKIGSNYLLNLDDQDDDAGELRRAHEAVKAENRDLKTKNTELNAVNVTLRGEVDAAVALANSDNKVKEIKDKHKAEIDSLNLANETKLAKTVELIRKTARDNVVNGMANEISLYPQLLRSVIADRVSVELDDDYRPTIIVLDKDAKPSKMTVDDLKTEFRSSEELKAVMKPVGQGQGAGTAPRGQHRPITGESGNPASPSRPTFDQLPMADAVARLRDVRTVKDSK